MIKYKLCDRSWKNSDRSAAILCPSISNLKSLSLYSFAVLVYQVVGILLPSRWLPRPLNRQRKGPLWRDGIELQGWGAGWYSVAWVLSCPVVQQVALYAVPHDPNVQTSLLKITKSCNTQDWIGGATEILRCFCKGNDVCSRQCTVVQSIRAVRRDDTKLYNQPVPWSRVFLEKPLGPLLVKKQPASHVTQRFIPVFTTACHLSLSSARLIQSTPCHRTALRTILLLTSHWRLDFSLRFPYQNRTALGHSMLSLFSEYLCRIPAGVDPCCVILYTKP